tara:strand:- start:2025 stop:2312 length:288 start_codon:yes stop_codon:yes gene_type:complete
VAVSVLDAVLLAVIYKKFMINPIIMNLLFMVLRTDLDKKEGDLVMHGHDKNMRFGKGLLFQIYQPKLQGMNKIYLGICTVDVDSTETKNSDRIFD